VVRQSSAKAPPPVRFWASPPIVLLVAAFLATAIAGPLIGIRQLDAASSAQIRLGDARSELDVLLRTQLAEETGVRGYIATRDASFLDADRPPDPDFDRLALDLEARLRAEGIDRGPEAIEDMRTLHKTWEQDVALPLMRDPGSSRANAQQSQGKFLTDEMSRDAAGVTASLQATGDAVQQSLRRRINATVAISAGVVTLFAIVAFWYALGRASAISRLVREQGLVDALQRTLRVSGRHPARMKMGFAYVSATREALVGGDLLDAWRAGPNLGWFLIADASGKGVEAARHAAFAQYALRALAADADDPAEVLARFNRLFLNTVEDPSEFMVVFLGAFEPRTQTLRYASAGHGTAYVRRAASVEHLPPTGPIVGLDLTQTYTTRTIALAQGDIVLLATDGLGEARSAQGEMFGEERIVAILRDAPADPQVLCDTLVASAEDFSGGIDDDMAIVALRVVPEDGAAAAPFDAIPLLEVVGEDAAR
jgi:CHASE3 domain sensor protein